MSVFRNLLMQIGGEPTPPTPTLRHIQLGDILKDKTLYFTFPDDFYTQIDSYPNGLYPFFSTIDSPIQNNECGITLGKSQATYYYVTISKNQARDIKYIYFYNKYGSPALSTNLTEYDISSNPTHNATFADPIVYLDTSSPCYQYVWIEDN